MGLAGGAGLGLSAWSRNSAAGTELSALSSSSSSMRSGRSSSSSAMTGSGSVGSEDCRSPSSASASGPEDHKKDCIVDIPKEFIVLLSIDIHWLSSPKLMNKITLYTYLIK